MGLKVSRRKGINVGRVIAKIVVAVIVLYVGGTIMEEIGIVMENTTSVFYTGLKLIGWTVNSTGGITDSTGVSGGILTVVGIIAVASIILEFVQFRLA